MNKKIQTYSWANTNIGFWSDVIRRKSAGASSDATEAEAPSTIIHIQTSQKIKPLKIKDFWSPSMALDALNTMSWRLSTWINGQISSFEESVRVCSDVVLQIQSHDHHCKRIPPTKRCCPMKGTGGLSNPPPNPPSDAYFNCFISTSSVGLAKQPPSRRRRWAGCPSACPACL